MIPVPVNVTRLHWQAMDIVSAEDESKETEVLLFYSQQRIFDPRKNYHINCITSHTKEELEVYFLKRNLVAILTQNRFLAAITTEHFIPITHTPEIIFVNCAQKLTITGHCAF